MMLILTVNFRDFTVHSFLKYICNIIVNAYTSKLELISIKEKKSKVTHTSHANNCHTTKGNTEH